MTPNPGKLRDEIEALSAEIHKCYCRAYERRFKKPYWTGGDYSKLDEATKDYDREMAQFMLEALSAKTAEIEMKEKDRAEARYSESLTHCKNRELYNENAELQAQVEALTQERNDFQTQAGARKKEVFELKARVEKYRRALEVYAEEKEWRFPMVGSPWRLSFNSSDRDGHGYETAKEALTERSHE